MKHKEMTSLMGQVVVVTHRLLRVVDKSCVFWITEQVEKRPGWVVGFRYLQTGEQIHASPGFPASFKQTGKPLLCLLVTYWPTMVPEKVPIVGWKMPLGSQKPYFAHCPWTDTARKEYSIDAKNAKRDAKGRFVRWG